MSIKPLASVILTFVCGTTLAQPAQPLPDPATTDPRTLGWMQGFPPAPEKTIRFEDGSFYKFPRTRWTFSHVRELWPTANVWRGPSAATPLSAAPRPLDAISFTDDKGGKTTWAEMLTRTYTDSILVLHKGRIVYEKYMNIAEPQVPHSVFSITKSFVGVLAATLAAEGTLDLDAPVVKYIPELKDGAYGDATVRNLMDMTVGVRYSEKYADPKAEIWDYSRAGGSLPVAADYAGPKTFYEFLLTLKKEGSHGEAFAYKTVNTEVLAWIIKRVSGKSLSALMSEKIWQPLGVENDAYFTVDAIGTEGGGGGLNLTLRDMARFGDMMRLGGKYNGRQIIPQTVIDDIRKGGDPAKFTKAAYPDVPGYGKGSSYRSMWWVSHNAHEVFDARGIHGQRIYIDPKADLVVVKLSSHPVASNLANIPLTDRAIEAVAAHLMND
ncbi:serine hydrolase domain-containing protein [Noviherbaspirillum saxi]|uniref:Class C beta-lactamase-related serine hydrolase n=1 Tax=Noviherbaspirillum saxi TaxID=2320863 RepID=A0A3A3FL22_9BURK|nr:serine hydrolase [Noviherbaspirillum saxi]RJF92212.1 class C beta-lactamase-related serine hydrolase [Noviherbaspirillum saxi]